MVKKTNQKNMEKQEVTFQLYYNPYNKKTYTRIYEALLDNHNRIYDAVYKKIVENPEIESDRFYKEGVAKLQPNYVSEEADPSYYHEELEDFVIERMQELSLMHYQFELMSLSNLYQVFEQQLRKWLFEEMTNKHNQYINQIEFVLNDEESDYGNFYNKFGQLQNVLKEMKLTFSMPPSETEEKQQWMSLFGDDKENTIEIPIVETLIWKTIRECNLISNTFKHGSGNSAKALYKLHPEYFETVTTSDTKLMNLYRITNMEKVLSVENISFQKYSTAMKNFWDKLKMHQTGSLMLEIEDKAE